MAPLVWLVTGATSGIGKAIILELLSRGDRVIASGRNVHTRLSSLPASPSLALLELDITSPQATLDAQILTAWSLFGHIDVLLNNAGTSSMCTAEESSESLLASMFNTNFFAPVRLTKSILPLFREQGSGILAYTSSSTAWAPLPFMSVYAASKAALSSYVEALHAEVRPLGLKAVAFECGGFPTHLGQPREGATQGSEDVVQGSRIPAYLPLLGKVGGMFAGSPELYMPGDLAKVGPSLVDVVKREGIAAGKPWAVRVALGSDGWEMARTKVKEMGEVLDSWKEVAATTDRDGHPGGTTKEYLELVSIIEKE
ncbi:hypothetical protein QBC34DRAFT_413002 [Podospora aff. communis PSN243]|uniref:Uncharacterized protein n=1 Tax=Podospora aff. communis PSN243 TaxID=3040156 RepID=A0AAV9GAT8_9PEZI|nr:hypothetical protein QBC34DRAFT_413002 [Podospora aff. communis PSN243]